MTRRKRAGKKRERWVVKVGSSLIASGGTSLVRGWMRQVAQLRRKHDVEVVWVTSGAVVLARGSAFYPRSEPSFEEKRALCAFGQPRLIHAYEKALASEGLGAAQLLVTRHDLKSDVDRKSLLATMEKLLRWDLVPVVNENDIAVRVRAMFRDNDALAAELALLLGADRLVLCTDVAGIFQADPKRNPRAPLLSYVAAGDAISLVAKRGRGSVSRGGMASKLQSAREAAARGIDTWITKGDAPNVLLRIAAGEAVGTRVGSRKKARAT